MNLAWGGSESLASSGMMSIMRREGGRQIEAHVSRHTTSVAQVNDGTAVGSARSHNAA